MDVLGGTSAGDRLEELILWGTALVFNVYLYPSTFLALDRFLAVVFPLQFREISDSGRLSCFKRLVFFLHLLLFSFDFVVEEWSDQFHIDFIVTTVLLIWIFVVLLTALSLYIAIAVAILKAHRKLAGNRHTQRYLNVNMFFICRNV